MSSELDKMIGARLKFYRLAKEITQTTLGRQSGVTFQQIQKYENGTNRVTVSRLIEFSRILGFSMAEFFDGIVESPDEPSSVPREIIETLAMPQAMELNRHFADINSLHLRRQIVQLLKAINKTDLTPV